MINFGRDFDHTAGGTPKKVRTLDSWVVASPQSGKEKTDEMGEGTSRDAGDEAMVQATGGGKPKDVVKPTTEPKAKAEPKAKPEPKPKAATEPAVNPNGETAKDPESVSPSASAGTTVLCADLLGKGICLEASAGQLWLSMKSPSADGTGKKISPFCMLWHTREGKLKSTPVVKEGMLLYKLTIMDNVCFCKKGEISVPKRLGDCLDDLGVKGVLHHAEWTSDKAPNLLNPPSQQMAFVPTDASLAALLENVKGMSQAML